MQGRTFVAGTTARSAGRPGASFGQASQSVGGHPVGGLPEGMGLTTLESGGAIGADETLMGT